VTRENAAQIFIEEGRRLPPPDFPVERLDTVDLLVMLDSGVEEQSTKAEAELKKRKIAFTPRR
jgi:hypothetical protein